MAASCLVVAESVFVGYLYNQDQETPPPLWLCHLVMKYMAILSGPGKKKQTKSESIQIEDEEANDTELSQINGATQEIISNEKHKRLSAMKKKLYQGKMISDTNSAHWKNIAEIIDRFFFRFCFIVIFTLTFLILVVLPLIQSP